MEKTVCKGFGGDGREASEIRKSTYATSYSRRDTNMTELLPIRIHMYVLRKILLTTVSHGCNIVPFRLTILLCSIPFNNTIFACSIPLDDY